MTADPWLAPHPDDRNGSPFGWDEPSDWDAGATEPDEVDVTNAGLSPITKVGLEGLGP